MDAVELSDDTGPNGDPGGRLTILIYDGSDAWPKALA
jgi:hypothetical protein